LPLIKATSDLFEHCAEVPERDMLIICKAVGPDWLIIIWQKLKPILSVIFAVMLITSLTVMLVNDLFNDAFTIGDVVSMVKLTVMLS